MSIDPKEKFAKPGKDERPQVYPGIEAQMVIKPSYGKDYYEGSGKLKGKKALITGGDSGIGRSVAVAFAKEGADIVISYLPEEQEDAQATLDEISNAGRKGVGIPGDLGAHEFCKRLIEKTSEELGGVDILVNNAAIQRHFKNIDEIKAKDFEEIYAVNVVSPFILSREAAKIMKPGSSIINTVSIQAYEPSSVLLPYAASKGAFVALTKGLSKEFLEKGIRSMQSPQGLFGHRLTLMVHRQRS